MEIYLFRKIYTFFSFQFSIQFDSNVLLDWPFFLFTLFMNVNVKVMCFFQLKNREGEREWMVM